ncbi:MAG TPA: PAS domain S-box protein [Draconibacterium sp.]|nr:PAS domain S-box protein [Draconibacterium sp.]
MNVKHKEVNFQLMVEASPIALVLVNRFGKIVYVNSHAEELFLYSKNELPGSDASGLIPEKYLSRIPDFFKEYFTNPVRRRIGESRNVYALKKNGAEFPVEIAFNPIVTVEGTLVMAAIIDITERKKANEQFRMVVESAPNAMILVDYQGKIVMLNRQAEVLFGYQREEMMGEKVELLIPQRLQHHHPELREDFYVRPKARSMGAGRDLFGVKKDGTEVPVEIGLNPIERDNNHFVLASIIDITERKKSEEAIRLYTKRIEDKNKELEQFTFIASHDLREPLNSISSLIELFVESESDKLSEEALKQLGFISQSANRMKDLVSGLLDYARLGKNSDFKKVDLNTIVKLVINDLEITVKNSGAKIKVDKLPVLNVLEMEIRLLFQNIISNAIKYCPPERNPEINISAKNVKGGWQFAVSDNGIGIPAKQKDKIFILFQRLHGRNEYDGIGIGLSHCRKIVELHDGKIWVESKPEIGSTFYFFIPVNE